MFKPINYKLSFPLVVAVFSVWSAPVLAARQAAVGAGITPLDATGMLNGVDMSASGGTGTLTVGVLGGPQTDIMTSNSPFVAGPVAVSTAASSQGNITFNSSSTVYGDIGVTQPGGPFFLDILGGNNGTNVNLLGSLFATTLNITGTGAVNLKNGANNVVATNFASDGTLSLAPNTTMIGALTTTAGAGTGTLLLGSDSVLNGAVGGANGLRSINVVGGSNSTGVSANISGAVDAFSFSLGTNTLNIGGALTIANSGAGGVVNTTLVSPTLYGNIRPVGITNLGPTLGINVTVPTSAYIPVGTQFDILKTSTGTPQSGTDGSVVNITVQNPTNPLYTFAALPLAGTNAGLVTIETLTIPLQVVVTPPIVYIPVVPVVPVVPPIVPVIPVLPIVVPVVLPPTQPIAAPLVPVLLNVPLTPDITTVLAAVNSFSDPALVVDAVAQIAPSTADLAAPLVAFQETREFQNLWVSHLDSVLCDDTSHFDKNNASCKAKDPKGGWWLKGFGNFADQKAKGAFSSYDSRIVGTMLAYDAPLSEEVFGNTRAGLGLGYAQTQIDARNSNTDANNYQTTAYVGHEQGPWFVYGSGSMGWNEYSGERNIAFAGINRTAKADYSGQNYGASANTGYHIPVQKFTLTPLASLQYTRLNVDNYKETGAGDINLNVKSQHYDFLESGLGAKIDRAYKYKEGVYVPEIHSKWFHELSNPKFSNNASFVVPGSASFATPSMQTADDTYNVGAGITFLSCDCSAKNWALEAVYDHDWRHDGYSADQGMMKLTGRF